MCFIFSPKYCIKVVIFLSPLLPGASAHLQFQYITYRYHHDVLSGMINLAVRVK